MAVNYITFHEQNSHSSRTVAITCPFIDQSEKFFFYLFHSFGVKKKQVEKRLLLISDKVINIGVFLIDPSF